MAPVMRPGRRSSTSGHARSAPRSAQRADPDRANGRFRTGTAGPIVCGAIGLWPIDGREASAVSGHIFVSYSRRNRSYVEQLVAYLTDAGLPAWFDYEIDVGDRFVRVIQEQINACTVFVPVLTAESVKSDWVDREIGYAHGLRKPILPLLLEPCEGSILLTNIQHEDVIGGKLPPQKFPVHLREYFAQVQ